MTTRAESSSNGSDSLEEVLLEYLEAVESGTVPNAEELYKRFPTLAPALREYIETEHGLLQMAGPTVADSVLGQASIDTSKIGPPTDTVANNLSEPTNGIEILGTPTQFGRYRIQKFLGAGAMGTVYLAFDEVLERNVALKLPRGKLENGSELAKRFEREAKSAAGLEHRNICAVHDVGEIEGVRYLAMSYVKGEPLSDALNNSCQMKTSAAIDLIRKLALALQAAHNQSVVHRDLKPANVMIDADGEPVLMDFGLALQGDREDQVRVTQHGAIIGTPAYMSPEQIDPSTADVGPASDMFSLGVIFYEMLTGRLPFRGGLSSVIHQILHATPTKPSKIAEGVDPALDAICMKMLSKRASDRFGSMQELATQLEALAADCDDAAFARQHSDSRRDHYAIPSRSFWLGIAVCCLALVPLGYWLSIVAFKTEFGTVEIDIPDGIEGIQIQLEQNGTPIRILDPEAGWEFSVAEGLYEVRHTGDQDRFEIDRDSLTVTRGDSVRLRLTVRPQVKLATLPTLDRIEGLPGPVNALALSPTNKWLIVAGIVDTKNAYIMLCDATGHPGTTIPLPGRTTGEQIAWFDDHRFAVGTSTGGVNIIDCNLGRIVDGVRRQGNDAPPEVATAPEHKLLAIASQDGSISIFDMIRGKLLIDQFGIGQRCRAMQFTRQPGGERHLVCGGHGRIFVRNLDTLKLRAVRFAGTQVHDLHVLKDMNRVIVAAADGTVELIDLEQGQVIAKYLGHTSGVESLSVSPDEKLLATGCIDGKVRLFELDTAKGLFEAVGERGRTKQIAADWVRGLLLASGGSYVAASGEWKIMENQSILRWTLPGGNSRQEVTSAVRDLDHPAKPSTETSSYEQHMLKAKEWLKEQNLIQSFQEFEQASQLAPDSLIPRGYMALLAQATQQNDLAAKQLDIARHLELDHATAESSYIVRAMLAGYPNSSGPPRWEEGTAKLSSAFSEDWHVQHTFGLWKLRHGEQEEASKAFERAIGASQSPWESAATQLAQLKLSVSSGQIENWHGRAEIIPKDPPDLSETDGQWLAAYEVQQLSAELNALDGYVARLQLRTEAYGGVRVLYVSTQGVQYENAEFDINAAAFSPKGARAALAPNSADPLYLWEPDTGLRHIAPGGEIRTLAFLTDSEHLLIGRPAGNIDVLNLSSLRLELTLPRIGKVNGIAADAQGKRIAVAYANSRCAVWDITTREPTNEQVFIPGSGWHVAFSPEGDYLAIGVAGQKLLLFDQELKQLASLESISEARFTWLDNDRICYGYPDTNRITSYSVANGNTTESIEVGHGPAVVLCSHSPDIVLSGHPDGSIWASDLANGKRSRVARLPLCQFAHLGLSADSRYLLATGKRPKKNDGGACCAVFKMSPEFIANASDWVAIER